jgi:hypothetical protein
LGSRTAFAYAVRETVTLPAGVAFADFQLCPKCYARQVQFAPAALFEALKRQVIDPVKDVQALLDRNAYVTRLYSTMSAAEMTVDPLFTFNRSLGNVPNVHTADRVIECHPAVTQSDAAWRIELAQGRTIRGVGNPSGTWPDALATQPSNSRIVRLAASGEGGVVEDNAPKIELALAAYNATIADPPTNDASSGCSTAGRGAPGAGFTFAALLALFGVRRVRRATTGAPVSIV